MSPHFHSCLGAVVQLWFECGCVHFWCDALLLFLLLGSIEKVGFDIYFDDVYRFNITIYLCQCPGLVPDPLFLNFLQITIQCAISCPKPFTQPRVSTRYNKQAKRDELLAEHCIHNHWNEEDPVYKSKAMAWTCCSLCPVAGEKLISIFT